MTEYECLSLIRSLLDDEYGITETAWDKFVCFVIERDYGDEWPLEVLGLVTSVRKCEGRVYLPSLAESDMFECIRCHRISDVEDSWRKPAGLICSYCNDQEEEDNAACDIRK